MDRPIPLKTAEEVSGIRRSCRIAAAVLKALSGLLREGLTTRELDCAAASLILRHGASPASRGGFPGTICISVNEVAAHGVPSERRLACGDLVTLDVSVCLDGWFGDAAGTYALGEPSAEARRLLQAAGEAVEAGVQAVKAGAHLGEVGRAVERVARAFGCAVLPEFVGHGIGRQLHEEPMVPHTGLEGQGARIVPGMVLTVEPALSLGGGKVKVGEDGWSLVTEDGSWVAQFEHTVAVFKERIEVLTALSNCP